jgi:hypothetical protein
MHSLVLAELVEDDDDEEEFVCFTDKMGNTISLPLTNFVPKYEERQLGRKLCSLVLTENSSSLIRLLNELFQKKDLYHGLKNEIVESSAFWIRNYSSIALQVSGAGSAPVNVKRRKAQESKLAKKSKGDARVQEINKKTSLEKRAESSWNGFCYIDIDEISVDEFDSENTARLVKEISLQLDPGKLVVSVAAYGPSVREVPTVNQKTVNQFNFKALTSRDVLSALKQIQSNGGQLNYFSGGKVLASIYRLEQDSERNVEQYIRAKDQFVTERISKKLTNQDWIKLCIEAKDMFDDQIESESHMRRLLRSFDLWSKHQIDTVINLVNNCEGPLLFQVFQMISNYEVKGLTPSEEKLRKKIFHSLSFEHIRLMSQTKTCVLENLLIRIKKLEIDLPTFKEEMKNAITLEKLRNISCHILKTSSFQELEVRFGDKVGDLVIMKYSEAVLSVKGAPNWHYRMLETYLNQLDNNIIPHTASPQYESFSANSGFSEGLKIGLIDNSSLVIVNMENNDVLEQSDIFDLVDSLSCQNNFSCLVIGSTEDICFLQVHLRTVFTDFNPILLSFERTTPAILNQVWKEDKQYGLFFGNLVENQQVGPPLRTNFKTNFLKALTSITERFSMPGQKLTFLGLPGNAIHVPKNISTLIGQRSNRVLFYGSEASVDDVRKKVGKMSIVTQSEEGDQDEVGPSDDESDRTVFVAETQVHSESLLSNSSNQ